jgi:hypothetical protein
VAENAIVFGQTTTDKFQMWNGAAGGYLLQSDGYGNASWVSPASAGALWTLDANGHDIFPTDYTAKAAIGVTAMPSFGYGKLVVKTDQFGIDLINTGTTGYGSGISFFDGGGNLRQLIYDNPVSGNLVIHPGWTTGSGILNVQGVLQIGDPNATGFTTPNKLADGGYSLYAQYGILTERVKVALTNGGNWSDYVFDKNYKLAPLSEVESYIKDNHHLPGVPSADDVVCDGIDMASMDATLLKKIEELTLYVLELKKENQEIKTQLAKK